MTARMLISGFILVLFCVFSACETSTEPISSSSEDILANQLENSFAQTKVDICHATSSDTNPWVLLSISEKAVDKHMENHDDLYPGDSVDDEDVNILSDHCLVIPNPDYGEGEGCPIPFESCNEQCEDVGCDTTGDPGDYL